MDNREYWFRPKYIGYGTGLPLNWKGWVHLAVLLGGVLASKYFIQHYLPHRDWGLAAMASLVLFVVPMIVLAAYKTEGGWHWHWGD
ncbi:MAG TPA: hypothetical protein VHC94_02865 [Nitrobacter sp.]|nr:hypothetical protein [Nitrobacter sp.]